MVKAIMLLSSITKYAMLGPVMTGFNKPTEPVMESRWRDWQREMKRARESSVSRTISKEQERRWLNGTQLSGILERL